MKRFLCVVAAAAMIASVAWGQDVVGWGQHAAKNPKVSVPGVMSYSDSLVYPQAGDAFGTPYITERYPDASQTSTVNVLSVTNGLNAKIYTSNAYTTGSNFAWKWLQITATTTSINCPIKFVLYGSPDGVTYSTLFDRYPGIPVVDTLAFKLYVNSANAVAQNYMIPISSRDGIPSISKYLQVTARIDTSATDTLSSLTVSVVGRQH